MASQTTLTGTESLAHMDNELKDKVCKVMYKLAALDDFFSFYRVVYDKMSLRGESISGLSFFISGCVDELREIVDKPDSRRE